jgi:hypothetical protein
MRSQQQDKIKTRHTSSFTTGDADEETFWMAEGSGSPLNLSTFTAITRGGSPDPAKMVCFTVWSCISFVNMELDTQPGFREKTQELPSALDIN